MKKLFYLTLLASAVAGAQECYVKNLGQQPDGRYLAQFFYANGQQATTTLFTMTRPSTELQDCETLFQLDSYDSVDGLHTDWYTDGKKRAEGMIKNKRQTGFWTFWYESGQKKVEGQYVDGLANAQWTYWYSSGQKMKEGYYKNRLEQGLWTFWYEDGRKRAELQLTDGRLNSETVWAPNGQQINEKAYPDILRELPR